MLNSLRLFTPTVVVWCSLSLSSFGLWAADGAREVVWHGYDRAIELANDTTRVVLCPQVGGRVLEYSLDGVNVLFVSDEERAWKPGQRPPSSAGRFDIGPELVVPKRDVLWSGEWQGEITGPRRARLVSQDDPATGVRLIRDFELHESSSRLLCTQTIVNVSDHVTEWCHWSRTFAVGRGICVIPLSDNSRFPMKYVMYEDRGLLNFYPDEPNIRTRDGVLEILGAPRKPKLGFDSTAGMIAYAAPNNLLFVKRFPTFPDRVYNEVAGLTISVWYPDGDMVELEPIGPRQRLNPGEQASFPEEWWLAEFAFPGDSRDVDLQQLRQTADSLTFPP